MSVPTTPIETQHREAINTFLEGISFAEDVKRSNRIVSAVFTEGTICRWDIYIFDLAENVQSHVAMIHAVDQARAIVALCILNPSVTKTDQSVHFVAFVNKGDTIETAPSEFQIEFLELIKTSLDSHIGSMKEYVQVLTDIYDLDNIRETKLGQSCMIFEYNDEFKTVQRVNSPFIFSTLQFTAWVHNQRDWMERAGEEIETNALSRYTMFEMLEETIDFYTKLGIQLPNGLVPYKMQMDDPFGIDEIPEEYKNIRLSPFLGTYQNDETVFVLPVVYDLEFEEEEAEEEITTEELIELLKESETTSTESDSKGSE